jgi:hypothetical protein
MSEALARAQRGLAFQDISMLASRCELGENADPKFNWPELLVVQLKHQVKQSSLLSVQQAEESVVLFRIDIDLGARVVADGESPETAWLAQIEADYRVDYLITDDALKSDQEALDEFALHNASFHLWPFWREYVVSQCNRMNLPKISIPMRLP